MVTINKKTTRTNDSSVVRNTGTRRMLFVALMLTSSCGIFERTQYTTQWSDFQKDLILSGRQTLPLRVYKITQREDSLLLRKKSDPVLIHKEDSLLTRMIDRLYATVRDSLSLGVGIAAPQVGILKQIIWVQRFDKEGFPFEVYLNPRILSFSEKKRPCMEGCLSIPNRRDSTWNRAFSIDLEYQRRDGRVMRETVEDFTSVIFQHEIDHLNGILYLDHLKRDAEK